MGTNIKGVGGDGWRLEVKYHMWIREVFVGWRCEIVEVRQNGERSIAEYHTVIKNVIDDF